MEADSGKKVTAFETKRSVIGDITIVPDSNGKAKYAYAADTGGQVYRITFGSAADPDPEDWTITRIASLGCGIYGDRGCSANRKFMFAPDVVEYNGEYYILLGSGDREKPLSSYVAASGVKNYFFMIKDKPEDPAWLDAESARCDGRKRICMNSLTAISATDTTTEPNLSGKKGWYLAFSAKEQTVTNAITVYGTVTFSTHTPAAYVSGQCSNLGVAKVYNINYANAAPAKGIQRYAEIAGGGLPPSPVAGMVTLDDGTTVPFVIGADAGSPLQGSAPSSGSDVVQPKANVFWNVEE
jgi:type IV pilus assembly protein PilY1